MNRTYTYSGASALAVNAGVTAGWIIHYSYLKLNLKSILWTLQITDDNQAIRIPLEMNTMIGYEMTILANAGLNTIITDIFDPISGNAITGLLYHGSGLIIPKPGFYAFKNLSIASAISIGIYYTNFDVLNAYQVHYCLIVETEL
jgi:hypothetical protein